jgi:hypothetical protein
MKKNKSDWSVFYLLLIFFIIFILYILFINSPTLIGGKKVSPIPDYTTKR